MRVVATLLFVLTAAPALAAESTEAAPAAQRQYTFAWKFKDGDSMAPRGGTTRGGTIELERAESADWRALREPDLTAFERDRRAILAMRGDYRVSFDFIEVAGFGADWEPSRPYQSWATEKVYLIEDRGEFISLQHLLVMRILDQDGKLSEPFVTKHWRQDWQYQPQSVLAYRGRNGWERVPVDTAQRSGAWSQTVYQVDDSPRYGDVARWQHFGNYSTWASADGWRPLPRREFTARTDYHLLVGSNRHTILPSGWVHEQQNNKVVLDEQGQPRAQDPVLAREFGFNRYERIRGFDFSAGDAYFERTRSMWAAVRAEWDALLARPGTTRLRGAPDKDELYKPLFELAGETNSERAVADADKARELVRGYLAKANEATSEPVY